MNFNFMNALIKKDLIDIAAVNVPNWTALGWVNGWNLTWINQISLSGTQDILSIIVLVLTIGFTLFKFYRAWRHWQWAKEDRVEKVIEEKVDGE